MYTAIAIAIDVVIVLIFGLVVFFFTKNGFDRAVLKLGKAWLSLAITLLVGPLLTAWLEDLFLRDWITNGVYASLLDIIENNPNGYNIAELFENLPVGFVKLLDGLGASLSALEAEFGSYTEASEQIVRAMAERISDPCVSVVSTLVGHIVGFVVPWLFFKWLDWELKKDSSHVIFRVFDHAGGFIAGVAGGYCLVMGMALLVRTLFQVLTAFDAGMDLMAIYNGSFVFKFLGEFDAFGAILNLFQTVCSSLANLVG